MEIRRRARDCFIKFGKRLEGRKYKEEGIAFVDRIAGEPVMTEREWEDEKGRVSKSLKKKRK